MTEHILTENDYLDKSTLEQSQRVGNLIKTWVEIDRSAVVYNLKLLRQIIPQKTKVLGVIKDDAYGLGLEWISRVVVEGGADWLGVANIIEAKTVRRLHPNIPILILGPSYIEGIEDLVENDITPIVSSYDFMEKLNAAAERSNKIVKVHIMVDTGMGRIGIWYQKDLSFFEKLKNLKNLKLEGICSHFSSSDEDDHRFTQVQLRRFLDFCLELDLMGIKIPIKHIANSAAALNYPESCLDMVRVGLFCYGIYSSPFVTRTALKPAVSLKTRIAFIKDVEPGRTISYNRTFIAPLKMRIGTISIGYSQGLNRRLSNVGEVLVRGRRAPIVGAVTMDQTMIEIGHIPGVNIDDEVVVIGKQLGSEISIEEMADRAGLIPYEILCSMNRSLPRIYIN